jgi:hypothetical protein
MKRRMADRTRGSRIRRRGGLRALALVTAVCFALVLSIDLVGAEFASASGEAVTTPREAPSRFIASSRTRDLDASLDTSGSRTAVVRLRKTRVEMRTRFDERGDDFESPAPRPIAHRKRLPRRCGSRRLDEAH